MKFLIKKYFSGTLSLFTTLNLVASFKSDGKFSTLLFAGLIFLLIDLFVKPFLKIITLPINLVSFGLFSWIINAIALIILIFFVPQFSLNAWTFPGFFYEDFTLPIVNFNLPLTYIVVSFIISIINTFITWVIK